MPSPLWQNSVGYYSIIDCARTNDLADDFRFQMMKTHVLVRLVGLLQHQDSDIRRSSIEAIVALAKFGRLIDHFLPCRYSCSGRRLPLQDGGNRRPCSSYWLASWSGLECTTDVLDGQGRTPGPVNFQCHHRFGRIRWDTISWLTVRGPMIWQTTSAPRWWKQMFFLVLLTCFKIRP